MRRMALLCLCLGLLAPSPAKAETTPTAQVVADAPQLDRVPEFSPQSGYLSLTGYLNLVVHQRNGIWLTPPEREAALRQQVQAHQGRLRLDRLARLKD